MRSSPRQLTKLLKPDDSVWVHDYQLIPLGRYLRQQGFRGPIGFFLHIPFPHRQVLRVLPNYADLVRDLCQYDLLGFQTERRPQLVLLLRRAARGVALGQ